MTKFCVDDADRNVECPFCTNGTPKELRKVFSSITERSYTLYSCKMCNLQFFLPMHFENVYESEVIEGYKDIHSGRSKYPDWTKKVVKIFKKINFNFVNKQILDIGAGDGINFFALKECFNVDIDSYTAIEVDSKSAEVCERRGLRIFNHFFDKNTPDILKKSNAKNPGKYDVILLTEVLEHQIHIREFLKTVFQLLKKDGIIAITVPNRKKFFSKMRENPGDMPPHHFLKFEKSFFRKFFRKRIVYMGGYSSCEKTFKRSAQVISRMMFGSTKFWAFCIPFIPFLRVIDKIKREGIVVFIEKIEVN